MEDNHKQSLPSDVEPSGSDAEDTAPTSREPKRRKNVLLQVVVAILAVALIVVSVAVIMAGRDSKESSQNTSEQAPQTQQATLSIGPSVELGLPSGYTAKVFANDLPRARDLAFSPGGTLLVSQLGSNKVVALPDKDKDGVADEVKEVAVGNIPHGLAFHNQYLFVAELEKVVRYTWDEANLTATFDKQLFSMPPSGHSSRTLAVFPDGRLYVSVGSTCNVCVEKHEFLAAVVESNINGDNPHVFISGSRNASFLAINPASQQLWATENSRDNLGDDIPPDEINILQSQKHYGWPYCYGEGIRDTTFNPSTDFNCATTNSPAYKVQAHSAPLGLSFVSSDQFPDDWQGDLLVAFHGSWNRSVPTGYKVVKLNVEGDAVSGQEDFITFKNGDLGRPVDLIFDKFGNLFVSDDKTGAVYIIQRL